MLHVHLCIVHGNHEKITLESDTAECRIWNKIRWMWTASFHSSMFGTWVGFALEYYYSSVDDYKEPRSILGAV